MIVAFALVVLAYLMGSLSPSVFLGKLLKGVDVREHGSGNAGTTNAFRVLGARLGAAVFVADTLKGLLPVFLARQITSPTVTVIAAAAAIAGHNWSVFLRGRGGKGVATGIGTVIAMTPLISLALLGGFVAVLAVSALVSLASLTATLLYPILAFATDQPVAYRVFSVIGAAIIFWAHRSNIRRLCKREERRVRLPWAMRRKERLSADLEERTSDGAPSDRRKGGGVSGPLGGRTRRENEVQPADERSHPR